MTSQCRKVDLFGGAIVVELPSTFADVSDIRQVPDNQEVFLDKDGFTSVVFDILERVEKPDIDALKYHLQDIVDDDADKTQTWSSNTAMMARLPQQTPAYTLFATSPPSARQRGRDKEPDFTGILLTLVRLVEQKTDIVVTINVPHIPGQYLKDEVDPASGKHGRLLDAGLKYREKILETFEVKDWNLFVSE